MIPHDPAELGFVVSLLSLHDPAERDFVSATRRILSLHDYK